VSGPSLASRRPGLAPHAKVADLAPRDRDQPPKLTQNEYRRYFVNNRRSPSNCRRGISLLPINLGVARRQAIYLSRDRNDRRRCIFTRLRDVRASLNLGRPTGRYRLDCIFVTPTGTVALPSVLERLSAYAHSVRWLCLRRAARSWPTLCMVGRTMPKRTVPRLSNSSGKRNSGGEATKAKADAHAAAVMPVIEAIRAEGIIALKQIARELTRRRVPTARGGRWDASRVRVLLGRSSQPSTP
jgi:hypothetical protein